MRFSWARSATDEADADDGDHGEVQPQPFELAATDLITVDGRRIGWIATDGERTSDWLNASAQLDIHGMTEIPLTDELTDAGLPGRDQSGPTRLDRDELIFVAPPPLPPNRHLRLHRRRVHVHLEMGQYEVSGQLHVRPGADAGDHVLRGARTMVPLTEVELIHRGDPEFRRVLPVLIINTKHVTRMSGVDTRVSREVPPPPQPVHPPAAPTAEPVADLPVTEGAQPDPMGALQVLLDAGVLTILEFQEKRAELMRRQAPG